jgi:hypothetical protein
MANDSIPCPDGPFHAWRNNFVTYVNGHLADLALAAGVMGAEIWGGVAWASRPRSCDPTPPGNRSVTVATTDFFNGPAVPIYSCAVPARGSCRRGTALRRRLTLDDACVRR